MTCHRIKKNGFTFGDLAIVPRIPKVHHNDIDISVRLSKDFVLTKPFIASPMDTVTNADVVIKLASEGALGVLHYNFLNKKQLLEEIEKVRKSFSYHSILPLGVLVKCEMNSVEIIKELTAIGVNLIAIDSLHTSPHMHIPVIKAIKDEFPNITIISGNVVDPDDCLEVIKSGASILRVGYSAASINDGKSMFGVGISQASAIHECAQIARENGVPLIADGGLRNTGDIALAFALGANSVMLGRMFASSYDTPGQVFLDKDKHKKKVYKGMSRKGLIDADMLAEGKQIILNADLSLAEVVRNMELCLKMSIARSGATCITDFQKNVVLQMLTQQAIRELEPCRN